MLAGYESMSSLNHEPPSLLEPAEDQAVVAAAAQKPRLSSAEQLDAIFQKIDGNREGLISKEELIAVQHEFQTIGDDLGGGCLLRRVGAFGSGEAGCSSHKSQLQASTAIPLPEVICCDTGCTKEHNAESTVETEAIEVGGGGSSAKDGAATAGGGDSFDGGGVDGGDGGGVNSSVSWIFNIKWLLLLIREMNPLKAGSFVLCLLSYFIDKQLSLSSKDTIYIRIAFFWGILELFVAPWHVPDANSTRLAQNMHKNAVLTVIMGVLTVMVTAVNEEFRVPVLISCLALVHMCRGLEEE